MSFMEKNTWLFGVIAIGGYAVYLSLVLPQTATVPLVEVDYVPAMLGSILGAIAAGILGAILLAIVTRADRDNKGNPDVRDKEIEHTGERVGNSLLIVGAIGAMILAWFEVDHFWIANAIYLGFVLSGVLSTIARLVIYRRGF